jgi:hypothetical protein
LNPQNNIHRIHQIHSLHQHEYLTPKLATTTGLPQEEVRL